ncbi:MAG TPA: GTP-binding protein [Candidatus Paceibacterota bacterium]|nr:GTP-binding protein [Candidatus Paceibacterota bacterium]
MQILTVVGSLRAGKSTFVESTILQATQSGALGHMRSAYLLNDRPSPDGRMVDGEKVRNVAHVIPFPNRCFTCEDAENLARKLLVLAHGGEIEGYGPFAAGEIDLVVIEGYGFVAGAETREALEMTGFPFNIFSLVDAEHLSENRAAYGEVIESQIASATLGIGITHAVNGQAETALDLVARHAKSGVPSLVIPKGHGMPTRLFARALFGDRHQHHHEHVRCGCGHSHGHHDHGHHGHDHAHHDEIVRTSFSLKDTVTIDDLRQALISQPVERVKGFVGGVRVDMSHNKWDTGDQSDRRSVIVTYSRDEIRLPDHFIDTEARQEPDRRSTKELLRQDIDPESAKAALERLASAIPTEPVILPGSDGLRVAVQLEELQILKQIAQRPSVKDEWLLRAVGVALRYWAACARFIEEHENQMDQQELSVSRLELGLSLGWWTNRFEKQLDSELVTAVAECRVGKLLALGMTDQWLHSNPKQAAAQAGYYLDVTRFAARHGEDSELLLQVLERGVLESTRRHDPIASKAWTSAYADFAEPAMVS